MPCRIPAWFGSCIVRNTLSKVYYTVVLELEEEDGSQPQHSHKVIQHWETTLLLAVAQQVGSGSGGKAGCLEIVKLPVRSSAPPSCVSKCL